MTEPIKCPNCIEESPFYEKVATRRSYCDKYGAPFSAKEKATLGLQKAVTRIIYICPVCDDIVRKEVITLAVSGGGWTKVDVTRAT